jgi:hypothetical protein
VSSKCCSRYHGNTAHALGGHDSDQDCHGQITLATECATKLVTDIVISFETEAEKIAAIAYLYYRRKHRYKINYWVHPLFKLYVNKRDVYYVFYRTEKL